MTHSQSLVRYSAPSSTSTSLTTSALRAQTSLISSRLFSAQTGNAIAAELLYRLLFDILNRILFSLQNFASQRLDQFSSFLERRALERQERRATAAAATPASSDSDLGIVREVGKLVEERGFICPITGRDIDAGADGRKPPEWVKRRMQGGPPMRPPRWVRSVLEGVEEGRMQERDFWAAGLVD